MHPIFLLLPAVLASTFANPYGYNQPTFRISRPTSGGYFSTPRRPTNPEIKEIYIRSDIENRFAHTRIDMLIRNPASYLQEGFFSVIIPDRAFITSFHISADGETYSAVIEEKNAAMKIYQDTLSKQQSAGLVYAARDSNGFNTSIGIKANSQIKCSLHYEELLERSEDRYHHVISINPQNIVPDFTVDVRIVEPSPITNIAVNPVRLATWKYPKTEINPDATVVREKPTEYFIRVQVSEEEQRRVRAMMSDNRSAGQLTIEYNVESMSPNGDILVDENGYFVHFFAPSYEERQKKHVIFVLDTSGSMYGDKIAQLKSAMNTILDSLGLDDYFNIVQFASEAVEHHLDGQHHKKKVDPFPATPQFKQQAKYIINNGMYANGGTNIEEALTVALKTAEVFENPVLGPVYYEVPGPDEPAAEPRRVMHAEHVQPIIVFLSDGDPTDGETNLARLLTKIHELNHNEVRIFSLAFGRDANFGFLRELSTQNYASAQKIYEASDAAIQLEEFYQHISALLLRNVQFLVKDKTVNNQVTQETFDNLFHGTEVVVAGVMQPKRTDYKISALTGKGSKTFEIKIPPVNSKSHSSVERLFAYLTVQQLLAKKPMGYREEVIGLAKRYSFVCPLTSLIVVKPEGRTVLDVEDVSPTFATGPPPDAEFSYMAAHEATIKEIGPQSNSKSASNETKLFAAKHLSQLTWLSDRRKGNEVEITVDGSLKYLHLSPPEDFNATESCEVFEAVGVCRPLYSCISENITNAVEDFMDYMCVIPGDFAGVCCLPEANVMEVIELDDNEPTEMGATADYTEIPDVTESIPTDEDVSDVTMTDTKDVTETIADIDERFEQTTGDDNQEE